jgi:hypothetical protein
MSKIMGIGITTIRECCRTIHRKIGPPSRLAIGLWAIREGMVRARFNLNPVSRVRDPYKGAQHEIQIAPEEKPLP